MSFANFTVIVLPIKSGLLCRLYLIQNYCVLIKQVATELVGIYVVRVFLNRKLEFTIFFVLFNMTPIRLNHLSLVLILYL